MQLKNIDKNYMMIFYDILKRKKKSEKNYLLCKRNKEKNAEKKSKI